MKLEPIIFDFKEIENLGILYDELSEKLKLPDYFGRNLDALWDVLTGEIDLPVSVHFINLNEQQLAIFHDVIELFVEASEELEEELEFECWSDFTGHQMIYFP